MSTLRNSQTEEEKELASEQLQAGMSALRSSLNEEEKILARKENSSRKRLAHDFLSPDEKKLRAEQDIQRKSSMRDLANPFNGYERNISIARDLLYAMGKTSDPIDADEILRPISSPEIKEHKLQEISTLTVDIQK